MGDKGSKFIVLFGTPIAHENDEERALRCALELRALRSIRCAWDQHGARVLRPDWLGPAPGIHGDWRRGQPCGAADAGGEQGQILVSGATQRYAAENFAWQALAPIVVKGKSGLIPVAALEAVQERPLHPPPGAKLCPAHGGA